jgi:hypothetical protein
MSARLPLSSDMPGSYHRLVRKLVWMVLMAVAACGPTSAEIKTAQTAVYVGDAAEMFAIVEATTAEDYKIAESNRDSLVLMTEPQWYSPEGGRQSAGAGDFVNISDRSVQLMLIVELVAPTEDRVRVTVTPKTFQHISGSPKPRELAPDDPNLPPWVTGRVESLQLAIHKRLQNYSPK